MSEKKYVDNNGLLYFLQKIKTLLSGKVDKVEGKQLSTNDYTTEEKNKLADLNNYTLPAATTTTLGGIKAGAGVEVTADGTLNATGGGTADSVDWSNVQNKPNTVSGYGITDATVVGQVVTIGSNSVTVPTNNNELTNGAGYQTASQVQTAITDATTDMATKTYVTQQLANINKKQVVESEEDMTDANTIYLMANSGAGDNIYDEYIVVDGKPEKVGTTQVDLTNYVQNTDLVAITNREIDELFAE